MASCPIIRRVNVSHRLEINDPFNRDDDWNEISGIAVSPTQRGPSGSPVIFGHNDGPNSKMVFAAWDSSTGERLKTINLQSNSNLPLFHQDWEDMTIGKCGPDTSQSCIYLADTGDNRAQSSGSSTQRGGSRPYTIYKIREPMLHEISDNAVLRAEDYVSVMHFDYRHSSSPTRYANCEAMFVDHKGWGGEVGDLYLATKWNQDKSRHKNRLFKIPASAWASGFGRVRSYHPFAVGEYSGSGNANQGTFYGYEWTGADMSRDGTKIALTWTDETHIFSRCPGQSVADAVAERGGYSCAQYSNPESGANPGNQYEAVAFAPDGNRMYNLAESLDPPRIIKVDLEYSSTSRSNCGAPPNPTRRPTKPPTRPPTRNPTPQPTRPPTRNPTRPPTRNPTPQPTRDPTPRPTPVPSDRPSDQPSWNPTDTPSASPSDLPSDMPSMVPSDMPSMVPSMDPTFEPSRRIDSDYLDSFQLPDRQEISRAGFTTGPDLQIIVLLALIVMLAVLR